MLSFSGVHECIQAQPHPFDFSSRHSGDHSLLLSWSHRDPDCTHSQRADGDNDSLPDTHFHFYTNGHAHLDYNSNLHQNLDIDAQLHRNSDEHFNQNFHSNLYGDGYANQHTSANPDAHTYIYTNINSYGHRYATAI